MELLLLTNETGLYLPNPTFKRDSPRSGRAPQFYVRYFMKFFITIIFSLFVFFPCFADEKVVHIIRGETSVNEKLTKLRMQNDLIDSAKENEKYGEMISRATHYDMAYPKDIDEYSKLKGFGVLWVTSHSRQEDELPIKNLRIKIENIGTIGLEPIYSIKSIEQNKLVSKVYGKNRSDSIYKIPLYNEVRGGALTADYSANRADFILGHLAKEFPSEIGEPLKLPTEIIYPDNKLFNTMLVREYPIVRNAEMKSKIPNPTFKRDAEKRGAP
jgi:hypothetical protein